MLRTDTSQLEEEIKDVRLLIRRESKLDMEVALVNYLGNLYSAVALLSGRDKVPTLLSVLRSQKRYNHFLSRLDFYEMDMQEHFVLKKKTHEKILGDIMFGVGDILEKIDTRMPTEETILTEKDFYDIFWQFMRSIRLESVLEQMMKDGKIYSYQREKTNTLGTTLHNPATGDVCVFVNGFESTLYSMGTLAHEFGHVYDLRGTKGDGTMINRSFYQSFYGEALPRTFERLFTSFLIENGILTEEAKDLELTHHFTNYHYLLGSFMLTLLPDKLLQTGDYRTMKRSRLFYLVRKAFEEPEIIKNYILDSTYFDIKEDCTYAYGDIISMFLEEAIKAEGFQSPVVQSFLEHRSERFDEHYLEEAGFEIEPYLERYQKKLSIFKK